MEILMNEFLENTPYLFPVFIIVIWIVVSKIMSFIGGWNSLKNVYSGIGDFSGKKWHMRSARIGIINYNSCFTMGINSRQFFFSVMFLFKIGHPELLVPITDVTGKEHRGLIKSYVNLSFNRVPGVNIRISRSLAETAETESRGSWKFERIE